MRMMTAQFRSFPCGRPVFPAAFIAETVLCPSPILGSFVADELATCARVYFWALRSVPQISAFVCMPMPRCFD